MLRLSLGLPWSLDQENVGTILTKIQKKKVFKKKNRPKTKAKQLFSKHLPPGPMRSISQNVRLSVCVSVCLCVRPSVCSLLRYRLNVFLPLLTQVGKVMESTVLIFELFCLKIVKNRRAKKVFFGIQNMGVSLILAYLQTFLSFCVLDDFFRFPKKIGF